MENRYNFTLYSAVIFIIFLIAFIFPDMFANENTSTKSIRLISAFYMSLSGIYLLFKFFKNEGE